MRGLQMNPSKTIFDYARLRGAIRECFGTESAFANAIHRSPNYVSKCFQGKTNFDVLDVLNAATVLQIPQNEIGKYFFTRKEKSVAETVEIYGHGSDTGCHKEQIAVRRS